MPTSPRALIVMIILLLAAVIGLAVFWQPQFVGQFGKAPTPGGGDFVLTSADGPVDTATLRGKAVLIYFGYTFCPDICPTALTAISAALKQLSPAEAEQVKVVFVSVDPARDTPQQMKDYVAFFHPNIVGVTGTAAQIEAVARLYGAFYARQDRGNNAAYTVDHSSWTYVLTPEGRLLGQIPHGASVETILSAIRQSLSAKSAIATTTSTPPTPSKGNS